MLVFYYDIWSDLMFFAEYARSDFSAMAVQINGKKVWEGKGRVIM